MRKMRTSERHNIKKRTHHLKLKTTEFITNNLLRPYSLVINGVISDGPRATIQNVHLSHLVSLMSEVDNYSFPGWVMLSMGNDL